MNHDLVKLRLRPMEELVLDPATADQAAVVLMLRESQGEPEILIIKRAEHPRDPWSGHLALPGGRAETGDRNLRAVALRETREEVGVDLEAGGLFLGGLNTLWPGNPGLPRIAITPIVAVAPPDALICPNLEVQAAFWLSLNILIKEGRSATYQQVIAGTVRQWPAYPSPHGPVWGITERILTQFLTRLEDR